MRYLWSALLVFTMLLTVQWHQSAVAATARHYTELTFPPLPEIQLPKSEKFKLKNGITVLLMEDRDFPLINGSAMFHTGDRLEPGEQVGLASITGDVLRSGGTLKHSADELNQILERRAASVETSIATDMGTASFSALSEDTEQVLGLFAEVLREPAFDPQKIDLAKTQLRGGIARRNDDPDEVANREFQKLIYGPTSPYARTTEYATIDNISREDVVNFYRRYFVPNNMILGIVGDFETAKMRQLIEQKFGDWKPDLTFKPNPLPSVSQTHNGGIFLVNQPQLTQSNILMGHLGGKLSDPDYATLTAINGVLNGFGGRFFNELRSRQGLAYSVYGYWSPRFDFPGLFIAGGQTRSEATVPFIQSVLAEIEKIRTQPVTQTELADAKDSVLNSFVFNFQTPNQTLARLMRYEYYGYPTDFIFQYRKQLEATTIEDIQRVANKYLKPENIVTLVVGNQQAIQPPLSSLNQGEMVQSIDITIPAPPRS